MRPHATELRALASPIFGAGPPSAIPLRSARVPCSFTMNGTAFFVGLGRSLSLMKGNRFTWIVELFGVSRCEAAT